MKRAIAIAASLLINLGVIAVFENSAQDALPQGEVVVTDLNVDGEVALAQATRAAGLRALPL